MATEAGRSSPQARVRRTGTAACTVWLLGFVLCPGAHAQHIVFDPFVTGTVTWTSNANFGASDSAQSDTIVEAAPGIAVDARGARYVLSGSVVLDGLYYVRASQWHVLPYADLLGRLEAIDDALFLEAAVNTYQTAENPYDLRPVGPSPYNLLTTTQYRLSPYFESPAGGRYAYGARSDNIWTKNNGETAEFSNGFLTSNRAFVEKTPDAWGGALSYEYNDSTYDDAAESGLTEYLGRAALRWAAFGASSWIGLRAGHERVRYGVTDESGPIYGIEFDIRPDTRTSAAGYLEHRFFGSAWDASLSHRVSAVAFSVSASRLLTTYAEQLYASEGSSSVIAELEKLLPSGISDPTERARRVRELADARGLNVILPARGGVYSTQVNVQTTANATAALLRPRSSAALTLYYVRTVPAPGAEAAPGATEYTNTDQRGASVTAGYLLSRVLALSGLVAYGRTSSIAAAPVQDESKQMSYRLALLRQLSPRAVASIGARWETLESTVRSDATEFAVFVGALYRF